MELKINTLASLTNLCVCVFCNFNFSFIRSFDAPDTIGVTGRGCVMIGCQCAILVKLILEHFSEGSPLQA